MSEDICPHCEKPIYDDEAIRCLYCGECLNRSIGFMGKLKYPTPRIIASVAVVLTLPAFILLMIR